MASNLHKRAKHNPSITLLKFLTIFGVLLLQCESSIITGVQSDLTFLAKKTGIRTEEQLLSFLSPAELERLALKEDEKIVKPNNTEASMVNNILKNNAPSMTDKLQFEKDQKSRIEAMREERVRMQLKSKEKKLRN